MPDFGRKTLSSRVWSSQAGAASPSTRQSERLHGVPHRPVERNDRRSRGPDPGSPRKTTRCPGIRQIGQLELLFGMESLNAPASRSARSYTDGCGRGSHPRASRCPGRQTPHRAARGSRRPGVTSWAAPGDAHSAAVHRLSGGVVFGGLVEVAAHDQALLRLALGIRQPRRELRRIDGFEASIDQVVVSWQSRFELWQERLERRRLVESGCYPPGPRHARATGSCARN